MGIIKKISVSMIVIIVLLSGCVQKPIDATIPSSTDSITTPAKTSEPTSSTSAVEKLKVIGQIGGPTKAVAVSGNYAYVGVGMRVMVLDISNPASPSEIGVTQPFEGEVRDIAVSGNFAYVAAAETGLYIVNITNPAKPITTGQLDTKGYAEGIAVVGNYAYVADGPTGMLVVDISEPAKPVVTAAAYGFNYIFDVTLAGSYAYLAAAGAGLLVVDVSDPIHPLETGNYDTRGYAYGVTVSGNAIYVADGWEGVQIINISNPAQPIFTETIPTSGWAMDATIDSSHLYIADAFAGLRVVDVKNVTKPAEVSSYVVSKGHAAKLAFNNGVIYVADIYQGLYIIDVTIPAQLNPLSRYNPMGSAHAVVVKNGYAYVAADSFGFRVIDLKDPTEPRELSGLDIKGFAVTIAVSDNSAFIIPIVPINDSGTLYTINISNPLNPVISSTIPHDGSPSSLFIQGTTLYNAGEWGLYFVDISNPNEPRELSFYKTTQDLKPDTAVALGVSVVGNIAYLAASGGGLYTIDISDPQHPVQLGVFNEPGTIEGKNNASVVMLEVAVAGKVAYVLDNSLLRVLDVSNPKIIRSIGSFALPDGPFNVGYSGKSLAIDGNNLYVADNAAGLLMLDITDPERPQLSGEVRLAGKAAWVSLDEKCIYVAAVEGGLYVIEKPVNPNSANVPITSSRPTTVVEKTDNKQYLMDSNINPTDAQNSSLFMETTSSKETASQAGHTYTVSSSEDTGPGTIREYLQKAQSGDTIIFDPLIFPPKNPTTIFIKTGLGLIQGGITIDGSNAGVILDGGDADKGTGGGLLHILSDNNVVKGLQIINFPRDGIFITGQGNIIGGDRTKGTGTLGEGNLISGNGRAEIGLKIASGNQIIGNYIGTDISGKKKIGHPWFSSIAFEVSSFNNRIENNVVAGTICITDPYSSYNEIVGNFVGMDATGNASFEGDIYIVVSTPFNRIGGNGEERNIINGRLAIHSNSDTMVSGNYFGTDSTGKKAIGNDSNAIGIGNGSRHNFIGGSTEAERNVINGNNVSQLLTLSGFTQSNFIMGNYIGSDLAGTASFLNQVGISFQASEYNFVQQNIVSGSSEVGIDLSSLGWDQPGANFNLIRANLITRNPKIGIGIRSGEGNVITGNSFTFNGNDGYDGGKYTLWDNGKQGNLWGEYKGSDKNVDGIGDTPYQIFPNGIDRFPLMKP
jgi:hypothetical protein